MIDKNKIKKNNVGLVICFLGTDGSGKSTIIELIKPILKKTFYDGVYYEHLRPNMLPSLATLFGNNKINLDEVQKPHSSPPSNFLVSLLRWLYYMLDYIFGYFFKIYPKILSGFCVWIFDRYYYDYLIDPVRTKTKLPVFILKLGNYIIPEPDIIICLGTKAEVIHKRKPELPLLEVKRQVMELRNFCRYNKRSVWIDTGEDIDISVNQTIDAVMKCLNNRIN